MAIFKRVEELSADRRRLMEALEDPDYDPEIIKDMLADLDGELKEIFDFLSRLIAEKKAHNEALDTEIKRLQARKSSNNNQIESIKNFMQGSMQAAGLTKFKTDLYSYGIQKNPPSVVMDESDIEKLPLEYLVIQPPTINKQMIKEALQSGSQLEFAHLEQGESLRIR